MPNVERELMTVRPISKRIARAKGNLENEFPSRRIIYTLLGVISFLLIDDTSICTPNTAYLYHRALFDAFGYICVNSSKKKW